MKVTVGLPFFNNEATLADAIRSVYAQTFQDWELILVDDGSADRSFEVARRVQDPRVRLVRGDGNRGLSTRLNQIARLARGQYLARMDADDLMHPERLARQIAILDAQPEVELVGSAMYSLDQDDRPRGIRGHTQPDVSPIGVLKHAPLVHPTITARTAWFLRNPYNEDCHRAEDRELYVRTFRDLEFVQLCDPLYFCREELSMRLDKYLRSCRESQMIFQQYGPALAGRPRTLALCFTSMLKAGVYRAFTAVHAERWLVRKRNTPLSEPQARQALQVLRQVMETRVPGLDRVDDCACLAS
jgi:glycosyltransferase involved in cell wall biosynthesis